MIRDMDKNAIAEPLGDKFLPTVSNEASLGNTSFPALGPTGALIGNPLTPAYILHHCASTVGPHHIYKMCMDFQKTHVPFWIDQRSAIRPQTLDSRWRPHTHQSTQTSVGRHSGKLVLRAL